MNKKPLYYTKAQEFLDLWEELGNKKEADYWRKKLAKAYRQAIQEGRIIF